MKKKRVGSFLLAGVIATASFWIMGQTRYILPPDPQHPLMLLAHLTVAISWLSLAVTATRVWLGRTTVWMRSLYCGTCASTFLMVGFYRWAHASESAGIPVQVCSNILDGGGRRWSLAGVLIDYAFWTVLFAGVSAAAITAWKRCTTSRSRSKTCPADGAS